MPERMGQITKSSMDVTLHNNIICVFFFVVIFAIFYNVYANFFYDSTKSPIGKYFFFLPGVYMLDCFTVISFLFGKKVKMAIKEFRNLMCFLFRQKKKTNKRKRKTQQNHLDSHLTDE